MAKAPPKGIVMNPLQFTTTAPPPSISTCEPPRESRIEDRAPKRSRAAEYIAALYIALVLGTPWLLREVSWLTPPSNGVEIQLSKPAPTSPALDARALAQRLLAR
jgi:hypothetical protein